MSDNSDFTPQGRAALATYLLAQRPMKTNELIEALGYLHRHSVYFLIDNLSAAGIPVFYDDSLKSWRMLNERFTPPNVSSADSIRDSLL